jgi:ubiquitin-like protein Pup
MAGQEQIRPTVDKKHEQEQLDQSAVKAVGEKATGEALKADLDELLDDIDEVLEENADEFVRNYIQKGGE